MIILHATLTLIPYPGAISVFLNLFYFSVAKATLESQMSVCQSVRNKNPSASQNWSYWLLSLSTIKSIDYLAYWPLYLSAIWPAFATSKPFCLVSLFPFVWWFLFLKSLRPLTFYLTFFLRGTIFSSFLWGQKLHLIFSIVQYQLQGSIWRKLCYLYLY